MKKIILIIIMFTLGLSFRVGTYTISGSAGFDMDLNDDDKYFYINLIYKNI